MYGAVYRTHRHASVNQFITACSMDDRDEGKRTGQNLIARRIALFTDRHEATCLSCE